MLDEASCMEQCPSRTVGGSFGRGRTPPYLAGTTYFSAEHRSYNITCLVTDALPQNGTYLRNGPGLWDVGEHSSDHIFDGYATLVRISFRRGCATGTHRQVESDAYKAATAHGRPLHRKFSQLCPSMQPGSLLDRVRNVVGLGSGTLLTDNANISVLIRCR